MPKRRLPRADDARTAALSTCLAKYNATAAPDRLISAAQFVTLNGALSPWRAATGALGPALQAQTDATPLAESTLATSVRFTSHFIQVINFAIERGALPASTRSYYQLPVTHAEVPDMNTCPDALLWAGRLSTGETARIADGGAPMAWPTIAEVNTAAAACAAAELVQSNAKDTFDIAQKNVSDLRPTVDPVIKDDWDTIEYNLRNETPPSLRRRAREWGVVYEGEEEEETPPAPPPTP